MKLVIVGGGISGLSAAYELCKTGHEVLLLESSGRLGGKILTTEVAGSNIDAGPDSFLTRDPEMRELCFSLGIGDELVSPVSRAAKIWVNGSMHALPKKHFLGVPLDLDELENLSIISEKGLSEARTDLIKSGNEPNEDETVGSLVRRRLGDEIMENLVGPLLGGINAGDADTLSLEFGVPRLFEASRHDPSLINSINSFLSQQETDPREPIFLTHPAGLQRVVDSLEAQITGEIRCNEKVSGLRKSGSSWIVESNEEYKAEGIIFSTPAFITSNIISSSCPNTARLLSEIKYASMAFITFAFPFDSVPDFDGSGFLVSRDEDMLTTACSWTSSKWAHFKNDKKVYIRLSVGRFEDDRALRLNDVELIEQLRKELEIFTGITADPLATRVTRWPNSFPQYEVGHGEKIQKIRSEITKEGPGVFLAGAAFNGLGLSACIRDGTSQAQAISKFLVEK